jgi:hypothetical protein
MWGSKMFKIFILGIVVLGIILGLLFLPYARIIIKVASEPFIVDLAVRLDARIEKILPSFDSIPAQIIEFPSGSRAPQPPPGFVTHQDLTDTRAGLMLVFRTEDLNWLVTDKVHQMVEGEGKQLVNKEILLDYRVGYLNLREKQADLKVHVEQTVIHRLDLDELKRNLIGKTEEETREILASYPGIREVKIQFWLHLMGQIPSVEKKIDILLEIE